MIRCCHGSLTVVPAGHLNNGPYVFLLPCTNASMGLFLIFFLQTIQAALKDEALFFQKNYPALSSRNGTPYLARTLNKVHKS